MCKTVLITGSSRGIGAAAARLFAKEGYNVVINYNSSSEKALSLAHELSKTNKNVIAIKANISVQQEVKEMFVTIKKTFGNVDILVNNAGISKTGVITDFSEDDWDNMFGVNVKGAFFCINEAIPMMLSVGKGKIINISSMWGVSGASCEVCYSSTKAAIIGLTKALAKELGPSNINVNCIAPGVIQTEMNKALSEEDMNILKDETPLMRLGTPEDVAKGILFLSQYASDFITGQVLGIDGGFIV
ncbi:MAG: glucose 1-dehydrogenase [Oscillospiraceae bacterium]